MLHPGICRQHDAAVVGLLNSRRIIVRSKLSGENVV